LIDLVLVVLDLLNGLFLLDMELVLLRLDLIHDWEILDCPVHDTDLLLLAWDLIFERGVGFAVLLELVVILELLFINGWEFVLFPSLVEVELSIELLDLLAHEVDLLLEVLLKLVKILVGWDELLFLLIVVLDLLHDLLELLIREHVLLDLVLDTLQILVFQIDLVLKDSEDVLELLFVGWLDASLFIRKLGDLLLFIELLLSLLFPVLGPLSSWLLGLGLVSDSVVGPRVEGLVVVAVLIWLVTLYSHL
jgi:hypothetical protein